METMARYRLMGAFTLAAILGVFGFAFWLNHGGGFGERSVYQLKFLGSAPGLRAGAAVQFNGIRVGEVTDLWIDGAWPQQVMATISIESKAPVRSDTRVSLDFQGLMGVTSVALRGGKADAPPLSRADGSPPLLVADPSAGEDLSTTAREALRRVDSILADNSESLRGTINNLNTFTAALAKHSDRIDGIVAGLERMTGAEAAKNPMMSFDLAAPRDFPKFEKTLKGRLAILEPTALAVLDTQKFLVRTESGAITPMQGNVQWSDTLPIVVQTAIVRSFQNATSPRSVVRGSTESTTDYQLALDLRRFEFVKAEPPFVVIELTATLTGSDMHVIAARPFSATVQTSPTDAPAIANAFARAFGQIAAEMVTWVEHAAD